MQKLGQHFLKNTAALEAIAEALEIKSGEVIIEIGPGHGELTVFLARAAERSGGKVVCIEKDHSLIAPLTALAEKEKLGLVTIIEGDVLKLLPDVVTAQLGRHSQYKIVGNIPYYITGKLLRVISDLESKPEQTVLLVQKEVAERICAAPPHMNRLAASVQFWAEPTIHAFVPRKDFSPPPAVDSAVIILAGKENFLKNVPPVLPAHYYRAVRTIFAQPRKKLLNNLMESTADGVKKEDVIVHLQKIGVDPGARPQNLGIDQIVAIATAPIWG